MERDWSQAKWVAYDISDNKRRTKLAQFLLKKGVRLQESVFLVNVDRHVMNDFLKALESMRGTGDKIDVAPLCGSCRDKAVRLHDRQPVAIVVMGPAPERTKTQDKKSIDTEAKMSENSVVEPDKMPSDGKSNRTNSGG